MWDAIVGQDLVTAVDPVARQAWLVANGLTGGPEYDPYNLGDYAKGAAIGNSGLYRYEDESDDAFVSRLYQASIDGGKWGTAGRGFDDLQNAGFVNTLAPVVIDGERWKRVGEDIGSPEFRKKLLTGPGADKIAYYFDQYLPADVTRNDPTYGPLMREDKYAELVRAIDGTKSEGFFAENSPWDAFSKTIGVAMGISGAINALGNFGYQSLASSLAEHAAQAGGSLSDVATALGISDPVPVSEASKVAGWSTELPPQISDPFTVTDGMKATNGLTEALNPADIIEQAKSAADPMEGMWKLSEATGGGTMTEAAKALGYNGTYEMLNAVNPGWLNSAGSAAAMLQKLGLTSAASALTSGASGSIGDIFDKAVGGLGVKDLLSVGIPLGGALLNKDASKEAAEIQANSAREALALQKYMFDTSRGDALPWLKQGGVALGRVGELLGISGDPNSAGYGSLMRNFGAGDLAADPIYGAAKDFQLGETRNILTNAASARGETDSGVLMKDLLKYGTGILTSEGGNAYNRYNANRTAQYNFLAPTANLGQTTGIQLGQLGQNAAQVMGQNITGAGNAQAAGVIGGANALNNGVSQALKTYFDNELLRRFLPNGTSGGVQTPYGVFAE